jgi:hypothetical protein
MRAAMVDWFYMQEDLVFLGAEQLHHHTHDITPRPGLYISP